METAAYLRSIAPVGGQVTNDTQWEKSAVWVYFSGCPKSGGAGVYALYLDIVDPAVDGRVIKVQPC